MDRDIERDLLSWQKQNNPMPLLLRGARQVGKTYIVEKFGHEHFEQVVTINFELQPDMIRCFDSLHPADILNTIFLLTQKKNPLQENLF